MPTRSTRSKQSNCSQGVAKRLGLNRSMKKRPSFYSHLTYTAYRIGGKEKFMELASLSNNEDIKRIVNRWNRLSKSDKRYISLDNLIDGTGITEINLLAEVSICAFSQGLFEIVMLIANAPMEQFGIIEKCLERCSEEEGFKERYRMARYCGLIE